MGGGIAKARLVKYLFLNLGDGYKKVILYYSLYIFLRIRSPPPFFLGLHPQHMEVPRLRGELEMQLLAYATARAMLVP